MTVVGINMISKHVKPSQNKQGGIQKMEAPLDASNVAVVCSKCKKAMTPKIQIWRTAIKCACAANATRRLFNQVK